MLLGRHGVDMVSFVFQVLVICHQGSNVTPSLQFVEQVPVFRSHPGSPLHSVPGDSSYRRGPRDSPLSGSWVRRVYQKVLCRRPSTGPGCR